MSLPEKIVRRLNTWDKSAIKYMIAGAVLIGAGILSSSALVAFTDKIDAMYIKLLGFIGAVCTALIAAYNPLSLGLAFRDAWRVLDSAVLRYEADSTNYPLKTVIDAVEVGEGILSNASKSLANVNIKPADPNDQ